MKILTRARNQKNWEILESATYAAETELQKLLADSPELISVQDVRPGAGTLLVTIREFPLPVGYIDLLAFSEQGDIAVIECKLAANPEVKRKVIGQALDYGAHLWKMAYNELDALIKEREGRNLTEIMREAIQAQEWDEEAFRTSVEATLENGSFILMIVVDEINEELSQIVRFMNACGNPAFSFSALEMRRFQSEQIEMLYPRVVGDTRIATSIPAVKSRKQWTEAQFFADAAERCEVLVVSNMKKLFEWAKSSGSIKFGTGIASGSYTYYKERRGIKGSIFSVFSNGVLAINFGYMSKIFSDEEIDRFRKVLAQTFLFQEIEENKVYYYNIPFSELIPDSERLDKFIHLVSAL